MSRLEVLKTYKIYIGGQFPRTESGRYYAISDAKGKLLGNMCLSSRKDVRNAVVAARKAFGGWSERAAMNRVQILYLIAEMLDGRRTQLISELMAQGSTKLKAEQEATPLPCLDDLSSLDFYSTNSTTRRLIYIPANNYRV